MKDTVRTFVAVETSESVRQRASELINALRAAGATVSWVQPQNMHLTLKFLDEVPLREIHRVGQAVEEATAGIEPFELEIRGAGAFPSPGRPRTLWLGTGAGAEPLGKLFARLENVLAPIGFRKEPRRFEAHLTIGRVRSGGPAATEIGRLVTQHADFDAGRFPVDELVVFSSQLTPKGPIYEVLSRAALVTK